MKLISIVTPCYNEEANVEAVYGQVKDLLAGLGQYRYEHVFIDNASTDGTPAILRRLAARDRRVKVIFNSRNFGHIRSPYHALLQARGDAVIPLVADLQDPVELIPAFLQKWEEGHKIVMGIKVRSRESRLMFALRRCYYRLLGRLSEIELTSNFYGFGLYDRAVIEILRKLDDPYPYFRGLIADLGFAPAKIEYRQPRRERGLTKNNFYTLYDLAMLGITCHSKIPLRLATLSGFGLGALSLLVALVYLVYKLVFWDRFQVGMAPLVIGIFFFTAVQLFFTGVLGEYIGMILTHTLHRPLVIEKERLNFDQDEPAVERGTVPFSSDENRDSPQVVSPAERGLPLAVEFLGAEPDLTGARHVSR
ncbi:MAG: glycosyltransferase family 2 protein [Thermoguttaceae bacterium]|jgi:glycosyltransferase involved in cell wall biosynthesis